MSKARYEVIDGVTRKVKKRYLVIDGVTHKIKKSYKVIDGVARPFYSGAEVAYTGAHTMSTVTISGKLHNLMTITGSGTLTVDHEDAKIWMCGGGAGGENATYPGSSIGTKRLDAGRGGGGGYTSLVENVTPGNYILTVGAAGARNKDGGASTLVRQSDNTTVSTAGGGLKTGVGGSGGGGSSYKDYRTTGTPSSISAGAGDGKSKYPFGLTSLKAHCAGGGGGSHGYVDSSTSYGYYSLRGGPGGSNGANGSERYSGSYPGETGNTAAVGGTQGGGAGGALALNTSLTHTAAKAATFYGSGGGGAAAKYNKNDDTYNCYNGGAGYQGVIYVAWPAA